MPELPDLEIIREVLSPRLTGQTINDVEVVRPLVVREAIATLRGRVGTEIHREVRDFLTVHGRGGKPCLACGTTISEIKARGRVTNFCRACQPGGLIRF